MERLWAPWRMQYITQEKPKGCIFCDKPQAGDDRAAHIVHRGKLAYVILNAFPYNNGHVMVAPYAHLSCLEDLPPETLHENLGAAAGAGLRTICICIWCPGGQATPTSCP